MTAAQGEQRTEALVVDERPDAVVLGDLYKGFTWDRSIHGAELFRKVVGVVGLGKVG